MTCPLFTYLKLELSGFVHLNVLQFEVETTNVVFVYVIIS